MIDTATAAATAAINGPKSAITRWSGESCLRLFSDACRDMQAIAVKLRLQGSVPRGHELRVLAGIPERLTMALCHLIAEVPSAIHYNVENKKLAESLIEFIQDRTNTEVLVPLLDAHDALQDEHTQILELSQWTGQESKLVACLTAVAQAVERLELTTIFFAPHANPQAALMAREMTMHLDGLKATLSHCATA
jgi:hypothetical protein